MKFSKTLTAVAAAAMIVAGGQAFADDGPAGEKVFKKCAACHSAEPDKNKVGPTLFGVVGRQCGAVEGYKYSKGYRAACEASGFSFDEGFLDAFLADPKGALSDKAGTKVRSKMSFKLKKEADRAAVIEHLKTLK